MAQLGRGLLGLGVLIYEMTAFRSGGVIAFDGGVGVVKRGRREHYICLL